MIDDVLLSQRDPDSPLGLTFRQEAQSVEAETIEAVLGPPPHQPWVEKWLDAWQKGNRR